MKEWQEPILTIQVLSGSILSTSGSPDPGDEGTPWV